MLARVMRWFCVAVLPICLTTACKTEEKKRCRAAYARAQETVKSVSARSADDLSKADTELASALADCEKAGLDDESNQLLVARKQVSEQLAKVWKKAARAKPEKQTPEQIARLEKEGDPGCPKGQAYKHRGSGKQIRCTGPLPIDMGWSRAEQYFKGRDYSVRPSDAETTLKLEHGSELLIFEYAAKGDSRPPKCLTIYPPPGMSWQEAVARTTGAPPHRLKKDGTVTTSSGKLDLRIDESEQKLVVYIGKCGA